jgi:UDP-N-acetylmuramoyl-tripeptide--D-alanyl-D-alanine ligase
MTIFFLSLILFLINGLSVLRLYQIKDYLYKRVIAQFYFPSAKKIIFNLKEYLIWFLILVAFINKSLNFLDEEKLLRIDILIFLSIFLFVLRFKLIQKIHFTPKVIIVSFLAFLINFFILWIGKIKFLTFSLLSTWPLQFLVFTLSFEIFNIAVKPYLFLLGIKVKKKIEKAKKDGIKIIGITGSYGKSSTKEFLVQLLSKKYKVISPPSRVNHEYALLKYFLRAKIDGFDYAVVEFGSYYINNIRWTTKHITPDIAYITGITKQHLFLFGSIENIIKGEGTEILSWIKEGIVLVNNNHQYFEKLKEEIDKLENKNLKIFTYGVDGDFSYKILEQNLEKTIFEFKTKNTVYQFETKIIFPMQIENLVGALAYISLIDDLENYKEDVKKIELPDGFLKLKIRDNLYIFDDSYNANPKGVFDALNYFQKIDFDYKIVIFNGLLELGKETKEIYQELAEKFQNFDKIILTSSDFFEVFREKLMEKVFVAKSSHELEMFLKSLKFDKVGVFVFNRLPERVKLSFLK